jgi:ribosomal protein S18 acetylase RimI-like enzyme
MPAPSIRPYRDGDIDDVVDVCIRTGDRGGDATGQRVRDDILADVYALPYLAFEPELAFVIDTGERVEGYILGCADTREFVRRYRAEWLPGFIERHGTEGDDGVLGAGLRPERMLPVGIVDYPAHLHIDLLPARQRQGLGRLMLQTFVGALSARGVPGVHLQVDPANTGAVAFYGRLGFVPLETDGRPGALFGMRL